MEILSWLFFIVFIGALIVVGGLLLKGYMTTGSPASGLTGVTGVIQGAFFGPKPEKRLEIMDQYNVDGRRRLVLIRRDDVEHLIMTGGPVDVVIETGIGVRPEATAVSTAPVTTPRPEPITPRDPQASRTRQEPELVEPTIFSRPSRIGQAASEG